jgi:hypothetical protein
MLTPLPGAGVAYPVGCVTLTVVVHGVVQPGCGLNVSVELELSPGMNVAWLDELPLIVPVLVLLLETVTDAVAPGRRTPGWNGCVPFNCHNPMVKVVGFDMVLVVRLVMGCPLATKMNAELVSPTLLVPEEYPDPGGALAVSVTVPLEARAWM